MTPDTVPAGENFESDPALSEFVGRSGVAGEARAWVMNAAETGELTGWAQSIFGRNGELTGCEVLARCPFPDGRLRGPDYFAEVLDGALDWRFIDASMLLAAARLLAATEGHPDAPPLVSWNTAPSSLSPAYVAQVKMVVDEFGLDAGRLCLELTEQMPPPTDLAMRALSELKEFGIRLALDDIGSSHAPIRRLRQLRFDLVKLERLMILDLAYVEGRDLVRHLVGLCHDLGAEVVAEGVETEAEREMALSLGCDHVQGHLLDHGTSTSALIDRLRA